jgi:hypothetical protein
VDTRPYNKVVVPGSIPLQFPDRNRFLTRQALATLAFIAISGRQVLTAVIIALLLDMTIRLMPVGRMEANVPAGRYQIDAGAHCTPSEKIPS